MGKKIPMISAYRLAAYAGFLEDRENKKITHVSSQEIAEGVGSTSAKVRKDLSYFGDFGKRGVGYRVGDLHTVIKSILGTNLTWKTVVIGAGYLGSALASYPGFGRRGFEIVAVFDNDPQKIGQRILDVEILDSDLLIAFVEKEEVDIVVMACPAKVARELMAPLNKTPIQGVLNFAPTTLECAPHIVCRKLDLSVEMEVLSFSILHGQSLGLE